MARYYPLSDSFMAVALLGFIVSVVLTNGGIVSLSWGVTLIVFFAAALVASFMTVRAAASRY